MVGSARRFVVLRTRLQPFFFGPLQCSCGCGARLAELRRLCFGSREKMSGNASAVSILAMMPLMRAISVSASAIFWRSASLFCLWRLAFTRGHRRALPRLRSRSAGALAACREHVAAIVVQVAVERL